VTPYGRCPVNRYDACLLDVASRIPGALSRQRCFGVPPWQEMPGTGQRFQRRASIVRPALPNVETTVLTWRVPPGWDGVIITVTNVFVPIAPPVGELVDGSGDLTWRLQDNFRYFRDLGNITISLGSLQYPYELDGAGYRIYSNDTIVYTVTMSAAGAANLDPQGRVICAITGWLYPMAEYRRAGEEAEQG
jgi:hypothetical protein